MQAEYIEQRGLRRNPGTWTVEAQLAVWKYVRGAWQYRNGRVHGTTNEEKKSKHREQMLQRVTEVLERQPQVGSSGSHLLDDHDKVKQMRYRQQRAWLRSVSAEEAKERKRVKEEWRETTTQRRLEVLRELSSTRHATERRTQQQMYRYFRLPEPLSAMRETG